MGAIHSTNLVPRAFPLNGSPGDEVAIQPKFRPVRLGKEDHLKRWTSFSKLFRLDRTDPLSFGPKFPEILVEWIAPYESEQRTMHVLIRI